MTRVGSDSSMMCSRINIVRAIHLIDKSGEEENTREIFINILIESLLMKVID